MAKVIADSRLSPVYGPDAKIWDDIKKLRRAIGGLQAKKGGEVPFPVKSAKELMGKFRRAMDTFNMDCFPVYVEQTPVPVGKGSAVALAMIWRLRSSDGSFLDISVPSYGADNQDKSTGKAITYGWKFAIMYLLSLPDADIKGVWEESASTHADNDTVAEPLSEPNPDFKADLAAVYASSTVEEFTSAMAILKSKHPKPLIIKEVPKLTAHKKKLEEANAE